MADTLRFVTCGSVDDGKSTLIGRLLWESKKIFEDQLAALARDSIRYGTQGDAIDLALLVDGLQAEREQGITIDVAYRYFATPRRRFVIADTPGHEQYTRNMATGASTADVAVLLVNAAKGLQTQTYRHARIAAMFGVRHLVMAVNKMDLVGWDEAVFLQIVREFQPLAIELKCASFQPIPVSALHGDNLVRNSSALPWFDGLPLLTCLEEIDIVRDGAGNDLRMAVQYVNRPSVNRQGGEFRGFCGRIASGRARTGDRVRVLPGGAESKIRKIFVGEKECDSASAGDSVAFCLEDEVDVTRGTVISSASSPLELSDQFEAALLCLSDHRLIAGRSYLFYLHTCQAVATITSVKYRLDVKQGARLAARALELNEIGVVTVSLDREVPFEPYEQNRRLGSFILVDRLSNQTVGAGMIEFALRRAANIHWQALDVDKRARAGQKLQRPVCLWFTGLPGAGKSTIANRLEKKLFAAGKHTYLLDGDNIRHGLCRDLGFTEADRVENIRRVTEVARLLVDAGLVAIVSLISPYRAEREIARARFDQGEFLEIFVDTPLEECERRDPKGLFAKARRGELINFTGIDSAYEPPLSPEVHLDTLAMSAEECADRILLALESMASGWAAEERKIPS